MPTDRKRLKSRVKKGLPALMAAFFLIQIVLDLFHSVTAFPFVHYGMFSESFAPPDSLLSYEVTVDGRRLNPNDFRIYRWDMIQQPLAAFDRQYQTGDFAFDKQKLLTVLPAFCSPLSGNLDNSSTLATDFPGWYRSYLSRLMGRPIQTLLVRRSWYRPSPSGLTLLNSTPWIDRE